MRRKPARGVEMPDYLEVGTDEVHEDPGSTLPQNFFPVGPSDAIQNRSPKLDAGDTLPPDPSDHPGADTVQDDHDRQDTDRRDTQAIVAGQAKQGRLQQDGPLPKRVLVVDDDLTARLYMRARLMLRGHVQIFEASNVRQALDLLHTLPDLHAAFLDVDMGAQNGFELCKAIRTWVRSQGGRQPRIYMITSRRSVVDKMRAKMVGADALLSKPPAPKELAHLLAQL
jgi:CheY-like chemotaxis protein